MLSDASEPSSAAAGLPDVEEARDNNLGARSSAMPTVDALDGTVRRRTSFVSDNQPFTCKRSDALKHVCLHAHHTEAQVINILRRLGISELPPCMLAQLVWEERRRQKATLPRARF